MTTKATMAVYTVRKGDEGKDFWVRIGSAFPHGTGAGFNILLDALPLDRKLVIREAPARRVAAAPAGVAPAKPASEMTDADWAAELAVEES